MQYAAYTVSVTNGSTSVIGTSTKFVNNIQPGHSFKITGDPVIYQVSAVVSDTQLTLSAPYAGATAYNVTYQITTDYTPNFKLAEINPGDADWTYHLTVETIRKIDEILTGAVSGYIVKGGWDASTNVPAIPVASAGNIGWTYRVVTAGTTNINGINNWAVGDTLISDGSTWFRIASVDAVVLENAELASDSATAAAASATSAATSATNAAASATSALASKTAAATSETNAVAAASSLSSALASFNTTFLGRHATDPLVDGSGNPILDGATYVNTVTDTIRVYSVETHTWANYDESAQAAANSANLAATNANASATYALASQQAAASSELAAGSSAIAAAASASNAATSASSANTSAVAAASSATTASTAAATSIESRDLAASSASAVATSETNALASKNAAASSASAAATSETNALASKNAAASSASAAALSATNAATSATNSGSSATASANSATSAATSATNAANSATAAATSATNAATSASSASSFSTAASNAASTAITKASEASTSASASTTSATNAANSATASATSATNAANSATAASTSKVGAEEAAADALDVLELFNQRFLGAKSSDPVVDNNGNPLVTGTLYYYVDANPDNNAMKVWKGTSWVVSYATLQGTLTAENNLADVQNVVAARTNIGAASMSDALAMAIALG